MNTETTELPVLISMAKVFALTMMMGIIIAALPLLP
jgi:hypothetical protein